MSEKIINKNFALSADFNSYVVEHPDVTSNMPNNACIVFEIKSDRNLTRANRELVKELSKKGEKCFKAIKEKGSWRLEKAFT